MAEYFACNTVSADKRNDPEEESGPVVVVLNGEIECTHIEMRFGR